MRLAGGLGRRLVAGEGPRAVAVITERLPALLRMVNIILERFGHVSNIC
jgi:hypothetical protein